MKPFFTLVLVVISFNIYAQTQKRACATNEVLQEQLRFYPDIADEIEHVERQTQAFIAQKRLNTRSAVISIPIVVHIIYRTANDIENVTDEQVLSQIDVLNKDYRRLNSDYKTTPSVFTTVSADCEIEFKLAKRTPDGTATTGIVRYPTTRRTPWGKSDEVKMPDKGGVAPWDASKYLNLYVCAIGSGVLGYSSVPGSLLTYDGVVIDYRYFGTIGTVVPPFNLGRTTTHEVGHWLNLRHVWGDTDCGDDLVNDTPVQQGPNYGCVNFPHITCGGDNKGDMFMNFMDYTDDACMTMFSGGQKTRIQALFASNGARAGLLTSEALKPITEACKTPTALTATDITTKTTVISWAGVTNISDYLVEYKVKNTTEWSPITVKNATSTVLFGLTPNTEYEFRLKSACVGSSDFTAPLGFKTAAVPVIINTGCTDRYESNNTFTTAKEIPLNDTISAMIGTPTDIDYFVFKTTSLKRNIQISLTKLPFDYDVRLYNSRRQLMGSSTRSALTDEKIILNDAPADYYYVKIFPNSGYSSTQCYKLIAQVGDYEFSRESEKIGLNEFKIVEKLRVYPNPVTEFAQIEVDTEYEGIAEVRITDMTGKAVLDKKQTFAKDATSLHLDITNLKDGLYLLFVKTGNTIMSKKLSVMKN